MRDGDNSCLPCRELANDGTADKAAAANDHGSWRQDRSWIEMDEQKGPLSACDDWRPSERVVGQPRLGSGSGVKDSVWVDDDFPG